MIRVAIIGSGDLGNQIRHMISSIQGMLAVAYFDDFENIGVVKSGIPVLGAVDDVLTSFSKNEFDQLILGIGYKHMDIRAKVYDEFKGKIPFAKIIHPSSFVDYSARIDEGCVVYPGCVIDQHVHLSDNVLLNVGCTIAHDTTIGAHSFLSPRVALAGFINVGPKVNLGINTTVIDNIDICANTRTGGGAVVTKNIESSGLYLGVPAKLINK